MMMKKQKFLSLVGAILMAVSLSACGNGTTQADGQTGATEKKQTVASVDANAGASIKGPASGKQRTAMLPSFIFRNRKAVI